uniref:Uncharacterized protein n=1 Tax=Arundo donax TaxID=35708 RepID=A0A0A9HGH0_ARUDO
MIQAAGPVLLVLLEHRKQVYKMLLREEFGLIRAVGCVMSQYLSGYQYLTDGPCLDPESGLPDEIEALGQLIWRLSLKTPYIGSFFREIGRSSAIH